MREIRVEDGGRGVSHVLPVTVVIVRPLTTYEVLGETELCFSQSDSDGQLLFPTLLTVAPGIRGGGDESIFTSTTTCAQ